MCFATYGQAAFKVISLRAAHRLQGLVVPLLIGSSVTCIQALLEVDQLGGKQKAAMLQEADIATNFPCVVSSCSGTPLLFIKGLCACSCHALRYCAGQYKQQHKTGML